jgi:hypothetical protein
MPHDLAEWAGNTGRHVAKVTSEAGSNPEAFGSMIGQTMIQPALMEGMIKGAPAGLETVGRVMKEQAPISGMIPRFGELRTMRNVERAVGRGVEKVGQKLRSTPKPGKVTTVDDIVKSAPEGSPLVEGQILPSNVETSYRKPAPVAEPVTEPEVAKPTIPKEFEHNLKGKSLRDRIKEIEGMPEGPYLKEGEDFPSVGKSPKKKINVQGDTYTDKSTGEILKEPAKSEPATPAAKIEPKARTIENAPPNQRAKVMRGMHDSVDILFEHPEDRELFGAGQNLFSKNAKVKSNLIQRNIDASKRVSSKYGLTEQQARKAVNQYNDHVKELTKGQPKYGESLNLTAPSFETFLKDFFKP